MLPKLVHATKLVVQGGGKGLVVVARASLRDAGFGLIELRLGQFDELSPRL